MSVTGSRVRKDADKETQADRLDALPVSLRGGLRVPNRITRTLERHFTPGFVASLYYFLKYRCLISTRAAVQISNRISFGKGTVVKPFAVIKTGTGRIAVGHHCAISNFNYISNDAGDLLIGDYVRIGPTVTIMGGSRNFEKRDMLIVDQGTHGPGISIQDDVLIGANSVILPGCHIGQGAVVGAGSVVTKDVPPYTIVTGVPASVLGQRE